MSLLLPPRCPDTIVAILAGDARQAARHQPVVAVAVGEQKDAQHQRPALEPPVVPDRRVRQRQELLDDVRVGRRAEPLGPLAARGGVEIRQRTPVPSTRRRTPA